MSKYTFEGVTLDMQADDYIVSSLSSTGEPLEVKTKSPIVAINYFTGQINFIMQLRAKEFLAKQNKNKFTGCNVIGLPCDECIQDGTNCNSNSNCQLIIDKYEEDN